MSPSQQDEPQAFGMSARMARALADGLRVRILAELSVRNLSPSRFAEEIGVELTQVSRHFRQLAEWGFIELVEERPGRQHKAAIEHIYRGIQRAYFDTSCWDHVPRSDRDKVSQATVNSFFARVAEAVRAGTFDEDVDRHLSWDGVTLDRLAWRELSEHLDDILNWLDDLADHGNKRLSGTEYAPIPTIVGLGSFRSPQSPTTILQASRRHEGPIDPSEGGRPGISPKMAKALSNRWRCRILTELAARPLSPSVFSEEIGGSLGHISRCFRELANWGYIEVYEEKPGGRRGGGVERVYRSLRKPYFDAPAWNALPRIAREELSQSFLSSYFKRVTEALDWGTFDADADRHFSWKPVTLDRVAWNELNASLDQTLEWILDLEAESIARVKGDVGFLIPTIVGLTSFRYPVG